MAQQINVPGVGTLQFPDGMSDQDMATAIQRNYPQLHGTPQGGQGDAPGASPGFLDSALSTLNNVGKGVLSAGPLETAMHMGSAAIGGMGGGLTYLGTLAATGDPAAAKAVQQDTQNALTYQPRTTAGKSLANAADTAMAKIPQALDTAGGYVTDKTGSPLAGTAVNVGGNALLQALGMRGMLRGAAGAVADDASTAAAAAAPRAPIAPTSAAELTQQSIDNGKAVGYTATPNWDPSSGVLDRIGQSIAGKASEQRAGISNQQVTNALAARSLSAPELGVNTSPSALLTQDVLRSIRNTAIDQGYAPIAKLDDIVPVDSQFLKNMNDIRQRQASPFAGNPDVAATANQLNRTYFEPSEMTDIIGTLRDRADDAFNQGRGSAGKAFKAQAGELESLLDRHLQDADNVPDGLVNNYRAARQLIAKTYTVGDNLNPSTGNVDAIGIGKQLFDGDKKITGDLKTVGDFANAAPGVARVPQGVALPSSPTTNLVAAAAMPHGAAVGALIPSIRLAVAKSLLKRNDNPALLQPAGKTFAQSAVDAIHGSTAAFQKFYAGPGVTAAASTAADTDNN
jgi:hypothetical protein